MKTAICDTIDLGTRKVDYRLVMSKSAKKLRVRVGPGGVEVLLPRGREDEVEGFLQDNRSWITDQLRRVDRLRKVRRPQRDLGGTILFRGEETPVRVARAPHRASVNQVYYESNCLLVVRGPASQTAPARSLENWLRRQARHEISVQLAFATDRLRLRPNKVFIMGQRTKWGNCSALRNLSFNWRLIMAPDFVLKYLVTHEVVHLAVPDHSSKFWLTVQSLCPSTERARQWLCANAEKLMVDLSKVCTE
jgi:predicted metal-dependent hydrolase